MKASLRSTVRRSTAVRAAGTRRPLRHRAAGAAGFTLVEMMISVGIMTVIMGATMLALSQAMRSNETAVLVTGMNNSLRTGMDIMIRDLLQVGSGLPPGHAIQIPCCTTQINLPGPPGPTEQSVLGESEIFAVMPGTGKGPIVNQNAPTACASEGGDCVRTDTIMTLAADSTFRDVPLVRRNADGTTIDVALRGLDNIAGNADDINIGAGPDRVVEGQLIMLEKGSYTVLLQVTSVDAAAGRITFAASDSLNLNVHGADSGSVNGVNGLNNWAPAPDVLPEPGRTVLYTTATRVRMITYYIDNTKPAHPKLVRRLNNGSHTSFDNDSGSVVAFDVDNLQISYDIADGKTNPAGVRFALADFAAGGKCEDATCSFNQIRKVNVTLTGRSRSLFGATHRYFHNVLSTQVSLRGMSFVNDYVQ